MRRCAPALLAIGALLATSAALAAGEDWVRIKGTRVSLARPDGFAHAPDLPALRSNDGMVSIEVSELSVPFQKALETYNESRLAAAGLMLVKREEGRTVAGMPAMVLYLGRQIGQVKYAIWVVAFGDDRETVVVQGIAPARIAKAVNDTVERTLLSARWDRDLEFDPFEGLSFVLPGDNELKFAGRHRGGVLFTRDGRKPESAEDPALAITDVPARVNEEDRKKVAETLIETQPDLTDLEIRRSQQFFSDGLRGFEMLAVAKDKEGKPVVVYQATLFTASRYYSFQGRVALAFVDPYVPMFTDMARRFRRR